MEECIWRRLTLTNIQCKLKKTCQNNHASRKEEESEPKCDCSVEETEAISDSFLLAEGLCHLPVKAQTKQINRQTVWSADYSWSLKICQWDKRQVHVLIVQQCYPEALGCLTAPAQRGAGEVPPRLLVPRGQEGLVCSQFPLTTFQTDTWDFPLCMAKNHTTDYRTKASPGLRHFPAISHVPPDHKHGLQGRHVLCWTAAWTDAPGMVVQKISLTYKGSTCD